MCVSIQALSYRPQLVTERVVFAILSEQLIRKQEDFELVFACVKMFIIIQYTKNKLFTVQQSFKISNL